jgi:hypothetical protein
MEAGDALLAGAVQVRGREIVQSRRGVAAEIRYIRER